LNQWKAVGIRNKEQVGKHRIILSLLRVEFFYKIKFPVMASFYAIAESLITSINCTQLLMWNMNSILTILLKYDS